MMTPRELVDLVEGGGRITKLTNSRRKSVGRELLRRGYTCLGTTSERGITWTAYQKPGATRIVNVTRSYMVTDKDNWQVDSSRMYPTTPA